MSFGEVGPGRTFGSYQVHEELGRGGMGRVYRATHVPLDRDVALKLLAEQYAEDEQYVQRFMKEARAAARLNHPNIVQIYDFGQVGRHWYLALELVDGHSLSHHLKTWGPVSEQKAIELGRQALSALTVAHEAGIVHRDVKPDNLILDGKGVLKLVDLGLAKKLDDPSLSSVGFAAGTPSYISPEQIAGRADIDGRADLYSLGVTLFQLVTGQTPFPGPTGTFVMARHLNERAPDPRTIVPELSSGFSATLLRLMTREREGRPTTARLADRELAALQGAPPAPLPPMNPDEAPFSSALETFLPGPKQPEAAPPWPAPAPGKASPSAPGGRSGSEGSGSRWDGETTRRLEELLAARIGPMARVLVRQAAKEAADLDDLRRRLAEHVPEEAARVAFLREARTAGSSGSSGSAPSAASSPRSTVPVTPAVPTSAGGDSSGSGSFPPHLLALAEQRLAAEIGPLARVLVKKEARRQTSWTALVEALAAHVPDGAASRRLREALSSHGG